MKRSRDDRVKPGKGIDGTEGEDFSRKYAKDPWGYGGSSAGSERAYEPPYAPASDGTPAQRTSADDFQFTAEARSLYDDIMKNDRPGGFDTTGKITAGVNRKQGK
jgi:hypothetical protein